MKQKKGNVSLKSPLNGSIVKSQKKSPAKGTPAKPTPKKLTKTPVKVVPPKEIDDEEEEDSEEEDSGADAGVADEAEGSDNEEEEEDDDEEEDEDDDEENGGMDVDEEGDDDGDDDEDDEEPVEAPIGKKPASSPAKAKKGKKVQVDSETGVPKIKTGALPKEFPKEQILVVTNLPKQFKQIDIVEVFAKFGTLHTIYNNHTPAGVVAYVAYTSSEEAEAAQIATDKIAKVKGSTISVSIQADNPKKAKKAENKEKLAEEKKASYEERKREIEESRTRTIYVKNIKQSTTEAQIKEHFEKCGSIEKIRVFSRPHHSYGFVTFVDESSVPDAVNLHNSVLDGVNIWVNKSDQTFQETKKDPQRTVFVKNNQSLGCVEPEKLNAIFGKCGEIENLSILCTKNVLAFVTFKEPKGFKKALKLNGTNAEGLELEVEEYKEKEPKNKTTIFVQNVKSGTTEEDIRELFATAGPIESLHLNNGYAVVKFEDVDGFCKSFTLNESHIRGNILFIEPFSDKKQLVLRGIQSKGLKRKGTSSFKKGGYGKRMRPN